MEQEQKVWRFGFDAKRAFHNGTGLGHYSRTLLLSLSEFFPRHQYFLFNPYPSTSFQLDGNNFTEVLPERFPWNFFPSAWRSGAVKKDLVQHGIDLYHGLSHEIPLGMPSTGIPSLVTMHDLIHERYPSQYRATDVMIYRKKFRYACANASHIIAISQQTRDDLRSFYGVPEEKITVCYQSCNPSFLNRISANGIREARERYGLPEEYFLYVGSVIERKNLLLACKALQVLKGRIDLPLVVIGDGKKYKEQVKDYIKSVNLESRVIFLSELAAARRDPDFQTARIFPALYQGAKALIYPSRFEGFGIPVLEGISSGIPVVTSNVSCLPEAGGKGAWYINPDSEEELAMVLEKILSDQAEREMKIQLGLEHAEKFSRRSTSRAIMDLYMRWIK